MKMCTKLIALVNKTNRFSLKFECMAYNGKIKMLREGHNFLMKDAGTGWSLYCLINNICRSGEINYFFCFVFKALFSTSCLSTSPGFRKLVSVRPLGKQEVLFT